MKTTILGLATATLFAAQGAFAQVCMETNELHAALADWYQESPSGPQTEHRYFQTQLWASSENGTWTLVRYYSPTSACVVDQGENAPQQVAELILND